MKSRTNSVFLAVARDGKSVSAPFVNLAATSSLSICMAAYFEYPPEIYLKLRSVLVMISSLPMVLTISARIAALTYAWAVLFCTSSELASMAVAATRLNIAVTAARLSLSAFSVNSFLIPTAMTVYETKQETSPSMTFTNR